MKFRLYILLLTHFILSSFIDSTSAYVCTQSKIVVINTYCLKVGKDATKRSLAGLLQHIRSARGQINGLEAVPDELVDEVGRLQSAEFEGLVALADEARLTSVEDAVAGFNIAGNSMERAGRLATLLGEQYAVVIARCRQLNMTAQEMKALLADFSRNGDFLAAIKADNTLLEEWTIIRKTYTNPNAGNVLHIDVPSLTALKKLRTTSPTIRAQLGLTDDIIGAIRAGKNSSYADLVTDLEKLVKKLEASPGTNIQNFKEKVINRLLYSGAANANKRQGAHGVIKVLNDDFETLIKGKTVKFEQSVQNMRGTTSYEDVNVELVVERTGEIKRIEVKYCENCVDAETIKTQFVERDLFNANDISEIKWRIYGQNINKSDLADLLKNEQVRQALNTLLNDQARVQKIKNWFGMGVFENTISNVHIDNFVNTNYIKIFN
jgi:hypothetical protein